MRRGLQITSYIKSLEKLSIDRFVNSTPANSKGCETERRMREEE